MTSTPSENNILYVDPKPLPSGTQIVMQSLLELVTNNMHHLPRIHHNWTGSMNTQEWMVKVFLVWFQQRNFVACVTCHSKLQCPFEPSQYVNLCCHRASSLQNVIHIWLVSQYASTSVWNPTRHFRHWNWEGTPIWGMAGLMEHDDKNKLELRSFGPHGASNQGLD